MCTEALLLEHLAWFGRTFWSILEDRETMVACYIVSMGMSY
jgi:hypothetical protein